MAQKSHAESIAYAIRALKPYKPYINAIYLYGSCARNEQKSTSDVDLFLQINPTTPNEIIRKIKVDTMPKNHQLPEVDIHFSKDNSFGPTTQFSNNLKKEAKLLWAKKA